MSPSSRGAILASIAGGISVSLALWLYDLLALSSFAFAGVSDAAAAERVLSAARAALFSVELQLFTLHLVSGALLGLAVARASVKSPFRAFLLGAGFTACIFSLALFGMAAHYPQLFSDRWWLSGGGLAFLQRLATHGLGPRWFDGALVTALVAALLPAGTATAKRLKPSAKPIAAASILVLVLWALRSVGPARASFDGAETPNVLILASDSLRTDRIEDEGVMPFTSERLSRGTLYRYAVTPISRTYPAWVSTLTGTEPRAHGVRHMFPTAETRSDVGATLFTELRDRGYFTFAVSDFAGDIFPGFEGGFEFLDTPHLTVDTLAQSTTLSGHRWSLPFLRIGLVRRLLPYWRNIPSLADPEWVADGALRALARAESRPFAGLVFFSTAHFPYVAPFPDYRRGSDGYRGRYLYHVPPMQPLQPEEAPSESDVEQIRARYDAALTAIDRAIERLVEQTLGDGARRETLLVITSDHGEELYEVPGIAGHGDTLRYLRSQAVPIYLEGPGVRGGFRSNRQVRHYDLPATVLSLLDPDGVKRDFGHGITLADEAASRPICVETGIWFWPGRPIGLGGERLDYPGISELLDLDPSTREMVLRDEMEALVESAKERGVILGRRLYREQLTPRGPVTETLLLEGPDSASEEVDLGALFQERCVDGDPRLRRLYGSVVFERTEGGVR